MASLGRKTQLIKPSEAVSGDGELGMYLEPLRARLAADAELAVRFLFPHWCRLPFSRLHRESLERYDARVQAGPWPHRRGSRLVVAAPRGYAKSAIFATLLPLLDICFRREQFIVLLSATQKQASGRLRSMREEVRSNRLLATLFPHIARVTENNARSMVVGGVRVAAYGAGCEIRGIGHGTARPTKIVLDDVEDSTRVLSARYRETMQTWYREVIEPLGDAATHIEVVGTVLHRDSLLTMLSASPHFETRVYRAIETWSARSDLWARWTSLLTCPDDVDRLRRARAFLATHSEDMLAGTSVLWPEKESYAELMEQLVALGRSAFFKEKQNEPPAGDGCFFLPEMWRRFSVGRDGRIVEDGGTPRESECGSEAGAGAGAHSLALHELTIVGYLDPSLGKGDWAAIATVGRSPQGVLYVLDVWLERCPPTAQVMRALELHKRWHYSLFGVEAVGFQSLLQETLSGALEEQASRAPSMRLEVRSVRNTMPKEQRIGGLEPLVAGGWLRFASVLPEELFAQARAFPHGRHDDALDALAGAVALARTLQPSAGIRCVRKTRPADSRRVL